MRQPALTVAILCATSMLVGSAQTANKPLEKIAPYPAATTGYQRLVIRLPQRQDETDAKVELLPGKSMQVDCNNTWFNGVLTEHTLSGWGYTYYSLDKIGGPASTRMACPPGQQKHNAFVPVRDEGLLLRYNSKLPIVVYVPNGFELRYRFWIASSDQSKAAVE
jgi:ecotin